MTLATFPCPKCNGTGTMTLYCVRDRFDLCLLVVATCSENALKLIRDMGLDFTLANTTTARVQKNIDSEPGVVAAFRIAHPHKNAGGRG